MSETPVSSSQCAKKRALELAIPMAGAIAREKPAPIATPLMPPPMGFSHSSRITRGKWLTQPRSSVIWLWGERGMIRLSGLIWSVTSE
jgi:hypothetical protein